MKHSISAPAAIWDGDLQIDVIAYGTIEIWYETREQPQEENVEVNFVKVVTTGRKIHAENLGDDNYDQCHSALSGPGAVYRDKPYSE